MNFYNEIDPYAAQWLRNLIKAGHIAHGVVDERDIRDIRPDELMGYTQCHFFAGIGGWPLALHRAGWPDDKPVWTGSCPCQPFSTAGKGEGFADERHLWPDFFHLISQCKPAKIFGEQVASKHADSWIDLVQNDLERLGYAFGAVAFPSAGVGAPHIRDRIYWVANTNNKGLEGREEMQKCPDEFSTRSNGLAVWMEYAIGIGRKQQRKSSKTEIQRECTKRTREQTEPGSVGIISGGFEGLGSYSYRMADPDSQRCIGERLLLRAEEGRSKPRYVLETSRSGEVGDRAGPVNGFWRDADWIGCTDGKFRPVEPGTFPMADGVPSRVGRLRAYGNAINVEAATEFIKATQ